MIRFKITLPDLEKCRRLGLKFEGQSTRTIIWLMGVATGVSYASNLHFKLTHAIEPNISGETNSVAIFAKLGRDLKFYGAELEIISDSPLLTKEQCMARGIPA